MIETPAGPVRVTITDVFDGRVRLGFTAARSIEIWRSEVLARNGGPVLRAGEGRVT